MFPGAYSDSLRRGGIDYIVNCKHKNGAAENEGMLGDSIVLRLGGESMTANAGPGKNDLSGSFG